MWPSPHRLLPSGAMPEREEGAGGPHGRLHADSTSAQPCASRARQTTMICHLCPAAALPLPLHEGSERLLCGAEVIAYKEV